MTDGSSLWKGTREGHCMQPYRSVKARLQWNNNININNNTFPHRLHGECKESRINIVREIDGLNCQFKRNIMKKTNIFFH